MRNKPSFGEKWIRWVMGHRALVIAASIALVMITASGLQKFKLSSDYQYFFQEDNPIRLAFDKLQNVYTRDDSVIIGINPPNDTVFNKKTLELVNKLTEQAWQVPYSYRVDSISNFQNTEANGDDLIVRDFVREGDSLSRTQIAKIKALALKEPLLVGQNLNKNGTVTAISIRVNLPGQSQLEVPEVANFVREMVAEIKKEYPHHDFYLSGRVMMNNAFNEASMKDMSTLTPLMYLIILVMTLLFLGSFFATLSTFVILFFSVLGGMGIGFWLGIPLTPPSSIAPIVILTLAIADSVHILKSVKGYMQEGMEKNKAIIEGVRVNFQPVFLTSLTTAIGFLSLNLSEMPPLHDLGNITAIGVALALLYSITLLPALVSILPFRVKIKQGEAAKDGHRIAKKFSEWVIRRRVMIVASMLMGSFFFFFQISQLELDDRFVNYFSKKIEFRQHTEWFNQNISGIYQIHYDLQSKDSQGITDPEFLQNVDNFVQMFRDVPEVKHVNSITDTFKRLNKNMHGDNPAYYKLPGKRDLAAQYLLLYEMSLPYGLDLNDQINVDKSSTRVIVTIADISTSTFIRLGDMGTEWLKTNTPEYMHTEGTSPTLMFSHITEDNLRAMFWGTLLAFFLITLVMIVALKSVKYGLISLIPNIIPAGIAVGIWSLTMGKVGFAISVVGSVTLGIIVDDTVHFLTKYVRAKREKGLTPAEAIRDSFENVASALIATSAILILGLGVMMFSAFKMNWVLGTLSAITIAIALLIDFTLLPALLYIIDKDSDTEGDKND